MNDFKVPDWILSPFETNCTGQDENIDLQLQEELVQLKIDLEAKSSHSKENFRGFWTSKIIVESYPKLYATVEPLLITFPSSYIVETGFSYANSIKQRREID